MVLKRRAILKKDEKSKKYLIFSQKISAKKLFKNYFELNCKVLVKVLTKFGIKFGHFEWNKVNKVKPRINFRLKMAHFPTNHTNGVNI